MLQHAVFFCRGQGLVVLTAIKENVGKCHNIQNVVKKFKKCMNGDPGQCLEDLT